VLLLLLLWAEGSQEGDLRGQSELEYWTGVRKKGSSVLREVYRSGRACC
jgi:hypothetical protein